MIESMLNRVIGFGNYMENTVLTRSMALVIVTMIVTTVLSLLCVIAKVDGWVQIVSAGALFCYGLAVAMHLYLMKSAEVFYGMRFPKISLVELLQYDKAELRREIVLTAEALWKYFAIALIAAFFLGMFFGLDELMPSLLRRDNTTEVVLQNTQSAFRVIGWIPLGLTVYFWMKISLRYLQD
jgi:hypothetical protein